jgi:hypothetical protein
VADSVIEDGGIAAIFGVFCQVVFNYLSLLASILS